MGNREFDEAQPALSPDGSTLVFVSTRNHGGRFGIFLGARPIEFYLYGQNADLFVMPALGGTVRKLADFAYDPSWPPDGRSIVFRSIRDGTWRLWTVSLEAGVIAPIEGVEARAIGPAWSPDGRWIAYVGSTNAATGWDLYVIPRGGGEPTQITHDRATIALRPAWSPDGGSIIFPTNRGGGPLNLWRVPFRADDPSAAGPPERVTTGIGEDVSPSLSAVRQRLAYATVHTTPDLWMVAVEDGTLTQLTSETSAEDYPRISPDGRKLMFYSDRSGREEVWTQDLETGELTQLSRGGGSQNAWSPDGTQVAFGMPGGGLQILDLTADTRHTIVPEILAAYPAFSPDGTRVAFQGWTSDAGYRLYSAAIDGAGTTLIPTPEGSPGNASWAPDGNAIYYQLDDSLSRRNIWMVDLESGESHQVTSGNVDDAHPAVTRDGELLLFLRNHQEIYVMPTAGGPERLVHSYSGYNQLIELPSWSHDDTSILFSLARRTGDIFAIVRADTRDPP